MGSTLSLFSAPHAAVAQKKLRRAQSLFSCAESISILVCVTSFPTVPRHTFLVPHVVQPPEHPGVLTTNLVVSARFSCGCSTWQLRVHCVAPRHLHPVQHVWDLTSARICTSILCCQRAGQICIETLGAREYQTAQDTPSPRSCMRDNSTGWSNAKPNKLVAGLFPNTFSGPTASPNNHRLRQGMAGGGGCDCAASLQDSSPALHALLINPLRWAFMKKGLCAISFGRRARDTRQRVQALGLGGST